jgi:tetratricopeptide (TPR) repeat protein
MQKAANRIKAWRTGLLLAAFGLFAAQSGLVHAAAPSDRLPLDIEDTYDAPLDALPVPGKDGLGPAPSPTPNKQDREDLLGGEAPFPDAASRAEALEALYDKLRSARDAKAAEPITEAIEQAWHTSGSDTVDLLMSRVDAFVLSAQLDLAAEVLDAVTDIAPDNAEAWHQRAIVSFMQKDNRRALGELRRALSIDPHHYKAIRDLGMVLQQIGDKKGALEAYRQALEINPFLEQARQAVDELVPDVEGQDI